MQKETRQQQETVQGKRHYEKPSLTSVKLFADMVLACNPDLNQGDSLKLSF